MADEMVAVLKELSGLVHRLVEQNDINRRRADEFAERGKRQLEESKVRTEEMRARSEQFRTRMERSREARPDMTQRIAQMREEDMKFRQRLLEEIQRHNELLETLIAKIGRQ